MKSIINLLAGVVQVAIVLLWSSVAFAQTDSVDLDEQIRSLQNNIESLERDISSLEKDLLFPPLTRLEVYLSHSAAVDFTLRSLTLKVDGVEKSFHIYTENDISALRLGGVQQFWEGNVALGSHTVEAFFEGYDRKGKTVREKAELTFEKTLAGRTLELQVKGSGDDKALAFTVNDWGEK